MNLKDSRTLELLLSKANGKYVCISTLSMGKSWKDNFFLRTDVKVIKAFISEWCDTHNVYMCPHGFTKKSRMKEHAVDPDLLYADLDEVNINKLKVKPTIALESSPNRYVGYWLLDKPATEDLNRRLTYYLDADNSGWDRSQVLRIPGTPNHKYDEKPIVKVLWRKGPKYKTKLLNTRLPRTEGLPINSGNIYSKYEKDIPARIRKEFTNPKPKQGKRSEVLWDLLNTCIEVGMSKEEAFAVCWNNPWNKHRNRHNGETQMMNELEKILGNKVSAPKPKKKKKVKDGDKSQGFNIITMDKVEREQVDWLVPGMIARGQTTIMEGDPGVGKSYLGMYMAIHICDGVLLPWIDKKRHKPFKGKVLYCDMENSAGAVTKSRLNDNQIKNPDKYFQLTEPFSVGDEDSLEKFEYTIAEYKPDIVFIDPVNLYIGNTDTYRASETQQALQHFKSLSEEYQFALVIVRHLNKGSAGGKALYAGNGSIAFAGVARIIATVGWHPEQADSRVVACTKNNLAEFFGSFSYTIESLPDEFNRTNRSRLVYEGHTSFTADQIVAAKSKAEDDEGNVAEEFIADTMKDVSEIVYHKLLKAGESRSISEKMIVKAAKAMGLQRITRGRGQNRETVLVR